MKFLFILVACVGCGSVKDNLNVDAANVDDGATPDAALPPVNITALTYVGDGLPELTARIVVTDLANNVVFDGPVDAAGHAQAILPATGGNVTLVRVLADSPTQLTAALTTVTNVKPGDEVTIGRKALATITNQGGQTTMSATFTPTAGATQHQFFTTCGTTSVGATSPATLSFRDSCHGATFDILGVATGPTLATPRFIKVANINHVSNGAFAIPGGFSTMQNFTVNALNTPAEISTMTVQRASMIENAAVATQSVTVDGDPAAGTVTTTVPFAQGVGTRSQVGIVLARTGAEGNQRHDVHTANLATSQDIDLGQHELPWITGITTSANGTSWTVLAPGDQPDGVVLQWSGRWLDGAKNVSVAWRIANPAVGDIAAVPLPALPSVLAQFDPAQQTTTVIPSTAIVFMVDFDIVNGYDEFRLQPDTLIEDPEDMGTFIGMPFERRALTVTVRPPPT
ncbi:MAG: hypothetical protein ABI867_12630 [Kofleriaceae bacterium]